MAFNNKTTGALRPWTLPDCKRTEIQRILNLMASSNLSKLLSLAENNPTTTLLTTANGDDISDLALSGEENDPNNNISTAHGCNDDISSLKARNTYALAMSGEMLHQHLVTCINARIQEGVVHRIRLLPQLASVVPRLRAGLTTWFLELLSPKRHGYFNKQRDQVSLVLKHCKVSTPFIGAQVSEFLWPLQRFTALLPETIEQEASSRTFFNVRKYFGHMSAQDREKKLIFLLLHFVLAGEYVDFTCETVMGELLSSFASDESTATPLMHACMLATKVLELKLDVSNLGELNIQTLKYLSTTRLDEARGLYGYQLRTFLRAESERNTAPEDLM
jgi:hypothetical protein